MAVGCGISDWSQHLPYCRTSRVVGYWTMGGESRERERFRESCVYVKLKFSIVLLLINAHRVSSKFSDVPPFKYNIDSSLSGSPENIYLLGFKSNASWKTSCSKGYRGVVGAWGAMTGMFPCIIAVVAMAAAVASIRGAARPVETITGIA